MVHTSNPISQEAEARKTCKRKRKGREEERKEKITRKRRARGMEQKEGRRRQKERRNEGTYRLQQNRLENSGVKWAERDSQLLSTCSTIRGNWNRRPEFRKASLETAVGWTRETEFDESPLRSCVDVTWLPFLCTTHQAFLQMEPWAMGVINMYN